MESVLVGYVHGKLSRYLGDTCALQHFHLCTFMCIYVHSVTVRAE